MPERLQTLVSLTCVRQRDEEVPGAWGLWFDLWAQAFRHPEVARDRIAMDQRWRDVIGGIVRDGQASGELGDLDIEDFAITWGALLDGLSIQVALEDPAVTSDRAVAIAMRMAAERLGFAAGLDDGALSRWSDRVPAHGMSDPGLAAFGLIGHRGRPCVCRPQQGRGTMFILSVIRGFGSKW